MIEDPKHNTLFINSIEKAFLVLNAFDTKTASLSLTEITQRTGLNKSAAQRYIYTLETLGYLEKHPQKKHYQLTINNLFSASAFLSQNELISIASPYIVQLREKFNARFGMSVLWQDKIVYLIALRSHHEVYSTDYPGFQVPVYCTTSGRMFLSGLFDEDIRERLQNMSRIALTPRTLTSVDEILEEIIKAREAGYCVSKDEYALGHINLAIPIKPTQGDIQACLVCVAQKNQWTEAQLFSSILPEMSESARVISSKLNG